MCPEAAPFCPVFFMEKMPENVSIGVYDVKFVAPTRHFTLDYGHPV